MKIILRDRNQVQVNELELQDCALLEGHKPRVVLIEDTNACYGLSKIEGNTGYFDECDYMRLSGVQTQATPIDETKITQH